LAKPLVVRFKVPASSANLGPGFDSLALALNLYDEFEMRLCEGIKIFIQGEGEKEIVKDENNLIVQAIKHLFWQAGKPFGGIEIKLKKNIPLTKGLGSSSVAIVAGLFGANELLNRPFKKEELFNFASHIEGHPDSVAASFFGGFTIAWREEGHAKAVSLPPPRRLSIVLGIPDFQIYTIRARAILPAVWPKEDVVYSLSRTALLTASLLSQKYDWLKHACQDRLHEPYRAQLIPGYQSLRNKALQAGALGIAISGSGPSVLAFAQKNLDKIKKIMVDSFKEHKIKCKTLILKPSPFGVK
jgi:homoserine kinase